MSKNSKKEEQYPVEFPSREGKTTHSPIVDVTENEIYPMELDPANQNSRHHSGVHLSPENITEVVTTEIEPDMAEQTIHGQQTQANI